MKLNTAQSGNPLKAALYKKRILLTLALLLCAPIAKAELVLYCQDELATGFAEVDGSWKETSFKPYRWTIRFNDTFTQLNLNDRRWTCETYAFVDQSRCWSKGLGEGHIFMIHRETLRYQYLLLSPRGWLRSSDVGGRTESMYVGTCETF
jgi:hypothetical protein